MRENPAPVKCRSLCAGHDRVIYAGIEEHEQEIDRKERGIPYHPEVVEWFESTFSELGMSNLLS